MYRDHAVYVTHMYIYIYIYIHTYIHTPYIHIRATRAHRARAGRRRTPSPQTAMSPRGSIVPGDQIYTLLGCDVHTLLD